tara:strand:- start:322 stop:687 length:366 start_codon:yes stop_codon:yes gene_type:complete
MKDNNYTVNDIGVYNENRTNYYEVSNLLTTNLLKEEAKLGILICGTGVGMSIAANRIKGIRAVCCSDVYSAVMSRKHNNSNVICLGSRVIGKENASQILSAWINTKFEYGRHQHRVDALDN